MKKQTKKEYNIKKDVREANGAKIVKVEHLIGWRFKK